MPWPGSRGLPGGFFCRSKDGVDNGHVVDGILKRQSLRRPSSDCERKQVPLYCVLIANREFHYLDSLACQAGPVVYKYAAGPVRWRIEWYLDFNPSISTDNLNPLVRGGLRTA